MAVVSSPANLARLDEYRIASERLGRAAGIDEAAAREMAASGKAVVWEVNNVAGATLAGYGWLAQQPSSRALSPCWNDISWQASKDGHWHRCS